MSETNFYSLKIKHTQPQTDSALCVTFDIPDTLTETFRFVQGQFLTLRANIDGEEVRRAYSICSGADEGLLQVAIKRVDGGKFSNFANDTFEAGLTVDVMPPQGSFYTELNASNQHHYMCIAVGSGITPILSIIKTVLSQEPNSRITLIYGNRQSNTMMFADTLGYLKNRYMTRFSWINIMSQEDQGSDLLSGHIDVKKGAALQKHRLIDINSTDHAFICGPESMMAEVSRGFRIEGLSDDQIHYELFSSSSEDAQVALEKAKQRVANYGEEKMSKVTVTADGRSITFKLATVGENILDAGIDNGMSLPYSCKGGVCSTCKAKLVKGEVEMDISHGLEQHEIDAGYILTCQAHPLTDDVTVDFDQR
ncbi:Phenylacetate-CoA oxygenase/reductase, PaaK subunit [Grimontia indica]|uniref:Phenylacetate-CoA oxygenase/reductase, PaaK subunit n=1 Tax=Grimontia indica TaxID=1056512 RepID=R1IQ26_9GAMM|nr:1,2-phenylacetyl-CoA epoxidase subunit PaaE [Grimontia indica]EOD79567.1 Phenylacetate-CoA oxygenase/reductase, PaaK subunit [Grimontia indica]